MSVEIRTGQGDNLIQCSEVSSSTEYELSIRQLIALRNYLRARRTYRRGNPYHYTYPVFPRTQQPPQPLYHPIPPPIREAPAQEAISTRRAIASVAVIFLIALAALYCVYTHFPNVTPEERQHIKIPWNVREAKQLGIVLSRYKTDHYYEVMTGVFVTYIFLQTFAIPGSLFLSILSGFLFPFMLALTLVCTCSAVGASLCFLLSQLLGRKLVLKYFPERARQWAEQVEKHRDNLFNYIVFLRVTPFLPNWFINLSAPVIGVPLVPFALGTFVGVAPPSFIAIQGGQTLHSMTEDEKAFGFTSFVMLVVFGFVSLLPILLKKKFKSKLE